MWSIKTAFGIVFLVTATESRLFGGSNKNDQHEEKTRSAGTNSKEMIPIGDICPQNWPPSHAMLHDRRADVVRDFEETMGAEVIAWNSRFDDTPKLATRFNAKYGIWHGLDHHVYSAWDPENPADYVGKKYNHPSSGWCQPNEAEAQLPVKEVLEGDWAAFSTWHNNVYGHFVHDHLPTIAYLRSVLHEETRFLLVDSPVTRNVIYQVDPAFYDRVKWIQEREVYHIKGSFTVAMRLSYEIPQGCCGAFDPLRQWLGEAHPRLPEKKTILYYQRNSPDATNGRVLESNHEQEVLQHIRNVMKRYNMDEELVIYNGMDPNTDTTMSIADQFKLFRSARTIIGPHGSGIGGNFAWTNPFPTTCAERTQLLEFIPGKDTPQVHSHPYVTHYSTIRKWPLDYHNILYAAESTASNTYINLQDLDDALRHMWGGGDPSLNSVVQTK